MKKIILSLLLFAVCSTQAQNGVLLVPFEDKMYRSAIDKELGVANGKSQQDIMKNLRSGLMVQLELAFRAKYNPFSLLATDSISQASLNLCMSSTGLEYIPVKTLTIEKENKPIGDKLKGAFGKDEKQKDGPTQSGIYKGEVVTVEDNREKYMNTVVHNPKLFSTLKNTHNNRITVFINEMDIVRENTSSPFVQQNQVDRVIKVHYTAFNEDGKEIGSGIAESHFSGKKNKLDEIINDHLAVVAQKIYKDVLNSEETLNRLQNSGK
ncbi:MAG: hypothetical protein ACK4K0_01655 [Flavobacteriales bacterium]